MVEGMVEGSGQKSNLTHTKYIVFCSKEPINSEKHFKETGNHIASYFITFHYIASSHLLKLYISILCMRLQYKIDK